MTEVYLLLGTNEGKRENNLRRAIALLEEKFGVLRKKSSVYETEAWGLKEQAVFLNQAVCIQTSLSASDLLVELKAIEKEAGRTPTVKWGPRVIDIDILFYGTAIINLPELKVPHPYLHQRRFTLVPLQEIAADFIHPVFNKTVEELLSACEDVSVVKSFSA